MVKIKHFIRWSLSIQKYRIVTAENKYTFLFFFKAKKIKFMFYNCILNKWLFYLIFSLLVWIITTILETSFKTVRSKPFRVSVITLYTSVEPFTDAISSLRLCSHVNIFIQLKIYSICMLKECFVYHFNLL